MQYDVAISYAAEQRSHARDLAKCLSDDGVRVFFDEYEDAQMWGKNLYDHLSQVYQKEARYCIVLVSRSYAERVWPNHERQAAQARALQEKGNEYILPVRFDDTDLPGLLPTVSYLNFKDYGAKGICRAFLRKVGKTPGDDALVVPAQLSVNDSPRLLVIDSATTIAYIPAERATWGSQEVSFSLVLDDPTDSPFLDDLQQHGRDIVLAYSNKAAICDVRDLTHHTEKGRHVWNLQATLKKSDFSNMMEVGTTGTSREKFAEMRTRRLLLNENPAKETDDMNDIMREILIRGQGVLLPIQVSPLPGLFSTFGTNRQRFLEIAWIHSVMALKLSNCVELIERLQLTLDGESLRVNFKGKRRKEYQNAPAHQIEVEGICRLR